VSNAVEGAEGLLVLRLWTEDDGALRVRIIASRQVGGADATTSYAASPAEVLAFVQDWLDTVVTPR
jgi:hypothetical protein